ncbi:hypothetical protein K505DRAFT_337631 [Melanomma pulvis-pyrius CBS 109.77]|uniref:Uncharacterized protein n=1 Tax=Melanomma pulvis-pyrius CBS 109.77 TaxID=1314802 RepID=A0A6A6XC76_9PLEO|nr:hypothetical protein K505DRAFT_337631 [Melanomma pulvis-pyrius CBS 109.77]
MLYRKSKNVRANGSEAEQSDQSTSQSPAPYLSSTNSAIVAEFITSFGDTLEQGDDGVGNTQDGNVLEEESGHHNTESSDGALISAVDASRGDGRNDLAPTHTYVKEAVGVVNIIKSQMQNEMVTHLETLDKIQVADFIPPNFSRVQPPTSGYMRSSKFTKFTKDKPRVTAHITGAEFTF